MSLTVSCAFPPGLETPEHIAYAEELGFARAWCYDSPALYADTWMTLARAAERTTRIELGPGVLYASATPRPRRGVQRSTTVNRSARLLPKGELTE